MKSIFVLVILALLSASYVEAKYVTQHVKILRHSVIPDPSPQTPWMEEFLRQLYTSYQLGEICGNEHPTIRGVLYVETLDDNPPFINDLANIDITTTFRPTFGDDDKVATSLTIFFDYDDHLTTFSLELYEFDTCYRLTSGQWWRTTEAFFRFYLPGMVPKLGSIPRYPNMESTRHWCMYVAPREWFTEPQNVMFEMLLLDDVTPVDYESVEDQSMKDDDDIDVPYGSVE